MQKTIYTTGLRSQSSHVYGGNFRPRQSV